MEKTSALLMNVYCLHFFITTLEFSGPTPENLIFFQVKSILESVIFDRHFIKKKHGITEESVFRNVSFRTSVLTEHSRLSTFVINSDC